MGEAGDPGVVVGARPAGLGVLPGQERRELARLDAGARVGRRLLGRRSAAAVRRAGARSVSRMVENSRSASSSRPAARVKRRSKSWACSSGIEPL